MGKPAPVCNIVAQEWLKKNEFPEFEKVFAGEKGIKYQKKILFGKHAHALTSLSCLNLKDEGHIPVSFFLMRRLVARYPVMTATMRRMADVIIETRMASPEI